MAKNLARWFSARQTPQNQPIPGSTQTANNAGGYAWAIDDWARLDRFLILGSEGGTYYVSERKLTLDNVDAVLRCIQEDGLRAVDRVVAVSENGKAGKNDPALFVLALASGMGDVATRRAAMAALPRVARIGTHLFHFLAYAELVRGWGRLLRNAVTAWYNEMDPARLAYQAVKYQQRDGWSHRDALRLAKPVPATPLHDAIYGWIANGWDDIGLDVPEEEALHQLWVYERAKRATTEAEIVDLVQTYALTWEFVPANWLGCAAVWRALLPNLPLTALTRNLGRMTANGVLTPMSKEAALAVRKLTDGDYLRRSRLHPLTLLVALRTYQSGGGIRGGLRWEPLPEVVDALDSAFYQAFDNVEPTGKRIMLALDVSGSMTGPPIAGMPGITPRVASAALALVTMRTESNYVITGFTSGGRKAMPSGRKRFAGWGPIGLPGISLLNLSPRMRLDDVLSAVNDLPFGGTDCALPMLYAPERGLKVDAFVIYTDSETWAGEVHPVQALQRYRERTGIPARLVVVGMTSNGFSIADPDDGGMLDVVGLSTDTPTLINEFIAGRV